MEKMASTLGWKHLLFTATMIMLLCISIAETLPGQAPKPNQDINFISQKVLEAGDCGSVTGMLEQFASGCFGRRVQFTASSNNPSVVGFMLLVTYHDPGRWGDGVLTLLMYDNDKSRVFRLTQEIGSAQIVSVTSIELLPGRVISYVP